MQRSKLALFTAAALAVGGIGLSDYNIARAEDKTAQTVRPSDNTAQQPNAAKDAAKDAAGANASVAARTSSSVNSDSARQALSSTSQAALSGKSADLTQQFSKADRERLGNIQENAQLSKTIDDLKAAYKEKYNQDLDLAANEQEVFTVAFFRVSDAADQARQAGATIGGTDSGATSAAGASTTGPSAAGTSGATAIPAAAIIIEASGSMPAVVIPVTEDSGTLVLDIPDTIDGAELTQNLQTHLGQALQQKDQWPADAKDASRAIARHVLIALVEPADAAAPADGAQPKDATTPGAATPGTVVP